ncbi:hypothetical protein TNCV_4354281 [Trichonephila clavipes]|nr:hypothetical protein TNCV_4354281 [Trichonephila clavipes]
MALVALNSSVQTVVLLTNLESFTLNNKCEFQECDEEDVETWRACDAKDYGFQMLNDDEIVTSVQEESEFVVVETDEDKDNNNRNKGPSNANAFCALETAMECCPTQLLLL